MKFNNKRCWGIVLTLTLFLILFNACEKSNWDLCTAYLSINIDNKGFINSMKNVTVSPACEFSPLDKPSPIMCLYNGKEKRYYEPQHAEFDRPGGVLTLSYANGSVAKVLIHAGEKYFKLTLQSLEPRNGVDDIQWGAYHTGITNLVGEVIGVARDTSRAVNYAIGVLSLNDNTIGGTPETIADASPLHYIVHSPDTIRFPLPENLKEGQVLGIGGDGISDVAFFSYKEPYYRFMVGNSAMVDNKGRISITYHSRDRSLEREVEYTRIPFKSTTTPNHLTIQPLPDIDYIGSSIALWGSPDSTALMDVIQNIVLAEGLPYPTINGKWVKDPTAFSPDIYMFNNLCDSVISYTDRLGFKAINLNFLGFIKPDRGNEGYIDGKNFEKKPIFLKSGNKSHKEFAEMAAKKGIRIGRMNISNSLAPGTLDASPVPSDSLCYQVRCLLTKDISKTDTVIYVDNPKYMDEIGGWAGHWKHLNIIKIGKELIHYLGVSEKKPYRLLNITRGYWGSKPESHQACDTIYKLQVTLAYGYEGLIPNMELQDKIAEYYADVCFINGLGYYDFDGGEFLFNSGYGYYSTKRFFRKMFEKASEYGLPHIRFSGSTLSEGSWHYQSTWNLGRYKNMYDVETREWGSSSSEGKDIRDITYANYFPSGMGVNFPIKANSTVEQYEHIQAISVGVGATYALELKQEDVESCPQKDAIFKAIRTWEDARAADAFPASVKKLLADPSKDWTLEKGDDKNSWFLFEKVNGEKINPIKLNGVDSQ
jgi:hypothetical protein